VKSWRIQSRWNEFVVRMVLSLTLIFSCLEVCAQSSPSITDEEIKTLLRDSIEIDRQNVGLAAGIVDEHGARVVCHGKLDNSTDRDVDGDTLFAIGSITKVFTALLLQDMVARGEMKLDDPVQKYLPESVRIPTFQGKEITLLHLATHTSALPRDSSGDLYSFLSRCKLQRAPGTQREYSNLGVGLLGHVIARKAGKDYETLVLERVCRPLGMNDTCITVPPESKARNSAGHAMPGHRVQESASAHNTNAFAPRLLGAGSIRSTANDLLKFVSAYAGLTPSPLSSVMQKAMDFHLLESGEKRPLVWESDGEVFEHGGLVKGHQAELAFDVKKRRGVVVLSNCGNTSIFVPWAWRGLLADCSPKPANTTRANPALYDDYAGLYEFGKGGTRISVRHENDRLVLQTLGRPGQRGRYSSYEVFPQPESAFCNAFWQIQVKFVSASVGQAPKLVLTSLGSRSGFEGSCEATGISRKIPPTPAPVPADPIAYDGYVGTYRKTFLFGLIRVGPTLVITHRKDELGSYLFASVREMGTEQIVPTGKNSFLAYDVLDDLRFTFVQNKKGTTKGITILWNGKKYSGSRISKKSI
jgi:D-alanyl-D-alanine-carboxypeptidase/D-alanyl-D-alanine-endopeptidase